MDEFLLPAKHPGLAEIWLWAAWTTPVFLIAQLVALGFLIRQVWSHVPNRLGRSKAERVALQLGIGVAPAVMLFVSTLGSGGYQLERGHWFFHTNDGSAGLVLLPLYLIGSFVIAAGFAQPTRRNRSWLYFVVAATLLIISLWYAFATHYLGMSDDGPNDLSFLAFVPLLAAINYALVLVDVWRHGELTDFREVAIASWITGLAVTLWLKAQLAIRIFQSLPVERPTGYGDCFVVTAAAAGHPQFVRSWYDSRRRQIVNRQLLTLQAFEACLRRDLPRLHRRLRRCYNVIGPIVASRIQCRVLADAVYILLKPAEWLARQYMSYRLNRVRGH